MRATPNTTGTFSGAGGYTSASFSATNVNYVTIQINGSSNYNGYVNNPTFSAEL
jgi:hypothetical protein